MVRRALDFIRGQSEELGSHIGEFQRHLWSTVAPTCGAAPGHDATHEPGHGGLDPRQHVGGASGRCVRRPVRGSAAPFPRIAPQLGRAWSTSDPMEEKRRQKGRGGAEEEASLGRLKVHSIEFRAGGEGGKRSEAFSTNPAHLHGEALITARPS